MRNLFNYIDRDSPVHRLTGAAKLVCLLFWTFAAMFTYDTRFLVFLLILSLILFRISKIRLKDVSFMLGFTAVFMLMNTVLLYLFSPQHGTEIYGTTHYITASRGHFALTQEQLFYQLNYILKYLASIPIVLLFVSTTNPSEFAASLNRLGVRYSVAYAVALAMRFIPDIQKNYHEISQAQQARGVEMTKKAGLISRLKSVSAILIPLILTSMDRINIVSNAMELRGFGKKKKRTWYMGREFSKADILVMILSVLLLLAVIVLMKIDGGRFYNPFV